MDLYWKDADATSETLKYCGVNCILTWNLPEGAGFIERMLLLPARPGVHAIAMLHRHRRDGILADHFPLPCSSIIAISYALLSGHSLVGRRILEAPASSPAINSFM
jgi:hypothetical protein